MTARIIAIANRKGGVGKTTTAVTMAQGIAEYTRLKVLLVDLDPQGNAAPSLGIFDRARGTLADLLLDKATLSECVAPADRSSTGGPSRPNLFLLASDDSLSDAKDELVTQAFKSMITGGTANSLRDILRERLARAIEVFDYIILDCPPSLDAAMDRAVYNLADETIVPVKVDYLGSKGTAQHTQDIIRRQQAGANIRISWILPTFLRSREILARQVVEALQQTYGSKVAMPIPQSVAVEQAPAAGGLTVLEYDPGSPAAEAYRDLIQRVAAEVTA